VNYFMKHSQKAAAVFLAFVMCLSLLPTAAFAAGDSRDTVSAPAKLDTAVLYEQLREDEEESVSVTAAQLFDLPNAGLEEQDGEEHYPAQLILNEGQEDERILTPEDLEDLAEAEQPTFRISENEIVLLSPDGGEEQIVTLSAAFDGWDEALPAQVQTFLDAVAEIPEEITADNAEEIAEYVYGPVSEAYEALLGTEYAEREDVKAAEAIYSQAVADVDAALDIDSSTLVGQTIQGKFNDVTGNSIAIRPNKKPNEYTGTVSYRYRVFNAYGQPTNTIGTRSSTLNQIGQAGGSSYAGSIEKMVGASGFYQRCPYNTFIGSACGHKIGEYFAPMGYCNIIVDLSETDIVDNINYCVGTFDFQSASAAGVASLAGKECLKVTYDANKPGRTRYTQTYYVNFLTSIIGGRCPSCFTITANQTNFSWHQYSDIFDINVYAYYTVNFLPGGNNVTNMPKAVSNSKQFTDTYTVTTEQPTREGYTFKGWVDDKGNNVGTTAVAKWYEGDGANVTRTLTAQWEENRAPEAPDRTDLNGLLGSFVQVKCVSNGTNLPHDSKVYSTWSNQVNGHYEASIGNVYRDGNTYKVDVTLHGDVYTAMYRLEPTIGIGVSHTMKDGTSDTQVITLKWDASSEKWVDVNERVKNTVLATFEVECVKPCSHPNVSYTDDKDGTHHGVCDACKDTIITNEKHNDYNNDGLCDKCNACMHTKDSNGHCTDANCQHIKDSKSCCTKPVTNPKLEKLEKERLTAGPSDVDLKLPDGVTLNYDQNVVFVGDSAPDVTLLYKITVTGTAGAQYKVSDDGATYVGGDPLAGTIASDKTTAVIYVTKTFTKNDVTNGNLVNNATLESYDPNHTDGPNNGSASGSANAEKKYNVTINFKTDDSQKLKDPIKTTVNEGNNFSYTIGTDETAKMRSADVPAVVIPQRLGTDSEYVLDKVASAQGLKKLAEAKNITADVTADIIYSLDTKGTIGTDDAGNPTDTSDGIPDKYQAKVTFKVKNGAWNDGRTADVVVYVEKYAADGETYAADGTATLADAEIPSAGEKPNANFKAGSWDDTPTKETQVSGDTVYTYTYTAIGSYTVTFDSNGGSAVTSQNVPEGGKVTKPADPTREGYTFNGWNLGDQAYDFSTPVTGDITLTAQWTANQVPPTPKKVTVSWLPGYGDNQPIKTETIDQGADYAGLYPANPSRSGYTFTGWSNPVTGSDGNITITAQWRQNSGGGGGGGSSRPTPRPDPNPSTQIEDPDVPLAGAPGLNTTDHYAYVTGYPDGTVRPQANITRAEVATIFFRLMTDEYRSTNWSSTNGFPDVANASLWYNNAVSTAAKAGLLKGKEDGKFYPTANITRAEFATIAARFTSDEEVTAKPFPDTVGHWAEQDIIRAVQAGWIKGNSDGTFRPNDPITRAEAMTLVNRMLDRVPDKDHMLSDMVTWPDNPVSAWFYEAVQEATNSHDYERDEMGVTETWTGKLPDRDWSALEKEWSNAASSVGNDVAGDLEKK